MPPVSFDMSDPRTTKRTSSHSGRNNLYFDDAMMSQSSEYTNPNILDNFWRETTSNKEDSSNYISDYSGLGMDDNKKMPPVSFDMSDPRTTKRTSSHSGRNNLYFDDAKMSQSSEYTNQNILDSFWRETTSNKEDSSNYISDYSGLGMDDLETVFSQRKPDSCRRYIVSTQNLNVHSKRRLESLDDIALTSSTKRRKLSDAMDHQAYHCPSPMSSIIQAVDRLSTDSDLVADGSRVNSLPIIPGKHSDLNAITPHTMKDLLSGSHDNDIDQVTVIDCRYPYEYDGGHIKGAINLYKKDSIEKFLHGTEVTSHTNHVLIFHCEFSSERGPKMYRFLRSLDRILNKDSYPRLNFPEVYLLEGGYKAFYEVNKNLCNPQTYTPMLHKEHSDDLRHFRVKSKSWTAGDKPRHKSRIDGSGVKLSF